MRQTPTTATNHIGAETCITLAAVLGAAKPPPGGSVDANLASLLHFLAHNKSSNGLTHAVLAVELDRQAGLLAGLMLLTPTTTAKNWPQELCAGFHRLECDSWVFTLCVGCVQESVAQWQCCAQHLWVGGFWAVKEPHNPASLTRHLARHCAANASVWLDIDADFASADWVAAGFVKAAAGPEEPAWTYQPRWPVPTRAAATRRTALVIGAGLAGAAVCASLTRRGWTVTLLDSANGPAQGASGLPVGLLSEHATARETTLSCLSRSGVALSLRELQHHVTQGKGWQASVVSHMRKDWDEHGPEWPAPAALPHFSEAKTPSSPAAMVRPAVLVQAWLAQARATGLLHERWFSSVSRLERPFDDWQAWDAQGNLLAAAAHVVVAAAFGSAAVLDALGLGNLVGEYLRPVKGQLSFAPLMGSPLASNPLRDQGVYVPCFDDSTHPNASRLWAMGSTYERGCNNNQVTAEAHERNAASLKSFLPAAHALLEAQRAQGNLLGWAQVRCASADRLPLVGALPANKPFKPSMQLDHLPRLPGAWVACALGSRGLTFSRLAAELLSAQMCSEPWPIEKKMALAMDPARFALKSARKKTSNHVG